jgi:two-component system cell cycle sensor histidine kinase/response regulator CckA
MGVFPLSPGEASGAPGRLVLLQNWRPTQEFIDQIRARLVFTGVAIFFLALGGGLYISRRMSQPIQDLAHAAGDIANGNWTRQVSIRGSAEAGMLARAFNDMTTSLRHWYEEAKKRDDQLRQAQKMEAIGRLAGGVAHDFNNLLTAIKGYGELLLYGLDDEEGRRASIEEILKAANRAAGLTRQLLAFGRRQVVAPRVLALDQVVGGTEPMLRRLIREDITLTTNLDPGSAPVRADSGQIDQVLVNLVVNASDAMPDGGKLRITVENVAFDRAWSGSMPPLPPGSYVRLSVADTGSGMDRATVAHIFEPFFTTKAEGRGTGLGLATVYAIVEQSGGGIEVDTELGRGTTFHIYLPQVAGEAKPTDAKREAHPTSNGGTETVLMVEDDFGVSKLISSSLRKSGYTVLEAIHGDQALEIVRHHHGSIHLLLTDVVMPGMNGRVLSERVAAIRPETRVLFMSGYSDDAVLRHGIQMASSQFIQKPFSIDELTLKIQEALKLQIAN